MPKTVLIIENEHSLRRVMSEVFSRARAHVVEAYTEEDALELVEASIKMRYIFDFVFTDGSYPRKEGEPEVNGVWVEFHKKMCEMYSAYGYPMPRFVVYSGTEGNKEVASKIGVEYIEKGSMSIDKIAANYLFD